MTRISTPRSSRWVAKEWRSACRVTGLVIPDFRKVSLNSCEICRAERCLPRYPGKGTRSARAHPGLGRSGKAGSPRTRSFAAAPYRKGPSSSGRSGQQRRCRQARPRLPVGFAAQAMSASNQPYGDCRQSPSGQRIDSDPQRLSAFAIVLEPMAQQWLSVCGPVQGLLSRCVRSAHALQLSRWILKMNPSQHWCNQAGWVPDQVGWHLGNETCRNPPHDIPKSRL
jgi:hypothetical protein